MKRAITLLCLLCAALVFQVRPAACSQPEHRFIAALDAYKNGDYTAAIDGFEALADEGIRNGKLYYNLGNAYLKTDDLGRALLWYERALTLIPGDPDLRFNYDYARSLAKDAREGTDSDVTRILFFWKYQLSAGTIKLLALLFNALLWGFVLAWRLLRRRGLRRAAWITALPAALFILTAAWNYYEAAHRSRAIVLPAQIAVRSGLEETSTELFKLHAGAKVEVVKHLDNHVQIRFSEDKIGWVPQGQVGII